MPIMAVGAMPGGRALMLGLSFKDIQQLMQGEPITGSLEKVLNQQGIRMLIFAGETEEAMKETLCRLIPTMTLPKEATADDLDEMLSKDEEEMEEELMKVEAPPAPLTHILLYGMAFCGFSVLAPSEWPEGHAWVRDLDELTSKEVTNPCPACLEKAKREH